ncbi:MAG: 4-hydroxythreonine-4-phosphate dehydrogenase PdxA [Pseudomonadota bacterium]
MTAKPRIALIPGDPAGIGPELVAKLLAEPETAERADILLVGDACVFDRGAAQAGQALARTEIADPAAEAWWEAPAYAWLAMQTLAPKEMETAAVSEAGGRSSLRTLERALDLAVAGVVDAVLFAPFNKASLHLAGLGHDDELHYMGAYLGAEGYLSELNTLDGIWTSRVTSHIPLSAVAGAIEPGRILAAIRMADTTLRRAGYARPRIAVAALNPHAGDNGNFGREEIDIIAPAVREAARAQIAVDGPWPSDTVFLKAKAGEVDAVVTMYHDQGQIALKLMGFDRGVTVQGGLPVPVATPAHGTAFDIAGRGVADPGATRAALGVACAMARDWTRAVG